MKKQIYLLYLLGVCISLSACAPSHFLSASHTAATQTPKDQTQPASGELDSAILRIPFAVPVTEGLISSTKWALLGYYSVLKTTDGKGSEVKVLPNTKTNIVFSELKMKTCPSGFVCPMVVQNYTDISVNSRCGTLSFIANQNRFFDSNGSLYSNLQLVLENKIIKVCDSNEDRKLFEMLAQLPGTSGINLSTDQNYLFLETLDGFLIFNKLK